MATFSEIAANLDKAVEAVETKQEAVKLAEQVLKDAQIACGEAVNTVRAIHAEYQKRVQAVVTLGGTVHK